MAKGQCIPALGARYNTPYCEKLCQCILLLVGARYGISVRTLASTGGLVDSQLRASNERLRRPRITRALMNQATLIRPISAGPHTYVPQLRIDRTR